MTEQIKPKRCGENTWYIPNQKGFVPKFEGIYWYCASHGGPWKATNCSSFDYALVEVGNCFETEQEAIDAFVKPADPTPLTWDELCEICFQSSREKDNPVQIYYLDIKHPSRPVKYVSVSAVSVMEYGVNNFNAGVRYWRSKESLVAWVKQQKGE